MMVMVMIMMNNNNNNHDDFDFEKSGKWKFLDSLSSENLLHANSYLKIAIAC